MLLRKCKPIPLSRFPTDKRTIDRTNCLAFALGIKTPKWRKNQYSLIPSKEKIDEIFLKKVKELGLNPNQFKKINREDEKDVKGYVIRVYGFAPVETIDEGLRYDFHLIRREPDGKWVHKPGFYYRQTEVTYEYWNAIHESFGNEFISFALEA